MPTYRGVGDRLVCNACGCEVIIQAIHDRYHTDMLERIAELERQIVALKHDVRTHELIGV